MQYILKKKKGNNNFLRDIKLKEKKVVADVLKCTCHFN